MERPMATVTCSDPRVNTVTSPDTRHTVPVSSCLWQTSATECNVIIITEKWSTQPRLAQTGSPRASSQPPAEVTGSSAESRPRPLLSQSGTREPLAGQWAWHQHMSAPAPLDTSDTRKCQAAWTKFLLFSRIYLLLWNTDWVFSVIQGINRRSSAESRLSSWLIA